MVLWSIDKIKYTNIWNQAKEVLLIKLEGCLIEVWVEVFVYQNKTGLPYKHDRVMEAQKIPEFVWRHSWTAP